MQRALDENAVIVAQVTTARDDLTLEAVGTGRAQRSVTLRPEASGKVVQVGDALDADDLRAGAKLSQSI